MNSFLKFDELSARRALSRYADFLRPVLSGLWVLAALLWPGCSSGADRIVLSDLVFDAAVASSTSTFTCDQLDRSTCKLSVHLSCHQVGEFVEVARVDCGQRGMQCSPTVGCVTCVPGRRRCMQCDGQDSSCNSQAIEECRADGKGFQLVASCDLAGGEACSGGACEGLCLQAGRNRSYVGCEFFAADLDNVALDVFNDASSQQFAVAVANPHRVPVVVGVEVNDGGFGGAPDLRILEQRTIPPYYLEVFALPRRELDGSSETGLNDGTHSAVSSNAFRIWSSHPVMAYQFNPLENSQVFSNDASLLLPTSAVGRQYSVVSWPQTIGNSEDEFLDFDSLRTDEGLRAFLTIIGTQDDTVVEVTFGEHIRRVVGAGPIPESGPGDKMSLQVNRFDVVNLETAGTLSDFTGTKVSSSKAVTVFVGSEASDVPGFTDLSTRQCCADHLEEQLFPDDTLGLGFVVAHMPSRTRALAQSAAPGVSLGVAEAVESERVRILAIAEGETHVQTSLAGTDGSFVLSHLQDRILVADADFAISSDRPIAVLQALPSQGVTGIPRGYPGGDPAIVMVPPREQYREEYIFLTPDKYAFDFVAIVAELDADVLLDGASVVTDPRCTAGEALSLPGEIVNVWHRVYRCQLSFPEVARGEKIEVLPGTQDDGVHRLVSNRPAGLIVYGFDSFVSYAYAGGLDLDVLF